MEKQIELNESASRLGDKEIMDRRAELLARESHDDSSAAGESVPMLLLRIGAESYGVELTCIWEVVPYTAPTPVPGAPSMLRGVVNFRGNIVPLYDIFAIITGQAQEPPPAGAIVVLGSANVEFAAAVDRVDPPEKINLSELSESLIQVEDLGRSFVRGITGKGIVALNVAAMFNSGALKINVGGINKQA